jgi:arabinofuranan 3-O-arabinosyltransferase
VSWAETHRVLDVAAVSRPTVVVVPENANTGWHAELAGRALTAVRIDGWQQGYLVPAGAQGHLVLTYGPDRAYRLGLLLGLVLALLVLVLTLWPARSARRREPLVGMSLGPRLVLGVGLAWLVVVAGWVGLVIALAVLAALAVRLQRTVFAQLAGGLAFVAVLFVAWRPFPSSDALDLAAGPQVLVLGALAVVVLALAAELGARGRRRSPPATEPAVEVAGTDAPPPAS